MANTIIQLRRSSVTSVPSDGSLSAAEPAYSYQSNKLFLGTSDGSGVVAIGGKHFIDQQNVIFDASNSYVAAANSWTNTVFGYSNTYTDKVGAASNAWANTVGAGANGWANIVFDYANTYTDKVGAASNAWSNSLIAGANTRMDGVGVAANNYADSTFLKLTGGTISGDLSLTGNLVVLGNTTTIAVDTLNVSDPLIYLASNNYSSDIVDIGFVANYNNGSCTTVHTGIFRDHASKEYYVFEGYDKEPDSDINTAGNNFTISVLNATLRTSNVILNGANLWTWINSAYTQANAAPVIANSYADIVGAAANTWANSLIAGANSRMDTVGTSANAYAVVVGAAANTWANSLVDGANTRMDGVGTSANAYAAGVGSAANTNAANASYINTGILSVLYGGTGATTFTSNGILYGNGTGAVQVTAAGTDGQVLVSQGGVPQFRMLDGGEF